MSRSSELKWHLEFGGLWFKYPFNMRGIAMAAFAYTRLSLITFITVYDIVIAARDPIGQLNEVIPFIPANIITMCHAWMFLFFRERCANYLDIFQSTVDSIKDPQERSIFDRGFAPVWKVHRLYMWTLIVTIWLCILISAFAPQITYLIGWEGTLEMVMNFPSSTFNDSNWLARAAVFTASFVILTCQIANSSTVILALLHNVASVSSMFKIVQLRLSHIGEVWDFKSCIEGHQAGIRLLTESNKILGLVVALQNLVNAMNLCFIAYIVFLSFGKNYTQVGLFAVLFIAMVFCTAALMFFGEQLQTEHDQLFLKLCQLPWYTQPVKMRKDYIFFIKSTMTSLSISYHGMSPLNMETLAAVFNAAYSYLMLLVSS